MSAPEIEPDQRIIELRGRVMETELNESRIHTLLTHSPLRSNPAYIRAIADALEILQYNRKRNEDLLKEARGL